LDSEGGKKERSVYPNRMENSDLLRERVNQMSEETKAMIEAVRDVNDDKDSSSKMVLTMVVDYLSVLEERASAMERLLEKLDSGRDGH